MITETAFRCGYPLRRWCRGLQVILEKKAGVRLVNKLRAILLMEADFNFGNKLLIGHRMLEHASQRSLIPPELYGGIKGKRADTLALSRRLFTDILNQKRRPGAIASVDAESCYDRISHTAASLACQRWGVPPPAIVAMLSAIQRMQFHLRTAFGDSSCAYSSDEHHLFQGICQGNGAGPAVWTAISSCIVDTFRYSLPNTPLLSPISPSHSLSLSGLLFVDDTDILLVGRDSSTSDCDIINELQHRVNLWEGLLHASGGALSSEKCSWSLISHSRSSPKLLHLTTNSSPGTISLPCRPSTTLTRPIRRLEPWETTTVVGVVQAVDGNMKGQVAALQQIANTWSTSLSRHPIPRHLAWLALRSKIWASLRYPLACTTITKNEGHLIVSRLYRQALPRLGAVRTLPNAIKFGPAKFQGLGLPHPYYYQGALQVSNLLHFFFSQGVEGTALRISWEHLQLQLGTATPFLSLSFPLWGHLATPCWLTSLWQFVSDYGIVVAGFPPVFSPLPRMNDRYIMDILVPDGRLSRMTLQACNRVRMGIHALTLTDLTTGDGLRLRWEFLRPSATSCIPIVSNYEWPPSPFSGHDSRLWNTSLLSCIGLTPPTSLGPWIHSSHHRYWEWWADPSAPFLYHRKPGSAFCSRYKLREGCRTRRQAYALHSVVPITHLSPTLQRTTITWAPSRNLVYFEGYSPHHNLVPSASSPTPPVLPDAPSAFPTLEAYLRSLPLSSHWPLTDTSFPDNGLPIAMAISNGTALSACDGSYMPSLDSRRASAAWIMSAPDLHSDSQCSGATLVSGSAPWVNSYRAELQGLHATLLATDVICKYHRVSSGHLRICCDNLRAVTLANFSPSALRPHLSHLDLLRGICTIRSSLPISVSIVHVTGHQDSADLYEALAPEAQLNVLCDQRAKQYLLQSIQTSRACPSQSIYQEGLSVSLDSTKLYDNISSTIMDYASGHDLRDYFIAKDIFTPVSFLTVNWEAIGSALSSMPNALRLWVVKFTSGFSGTAVRLHQWNLWPSPLCPCCGLSPEYTIHLMECSSPPIVEARSRGLATLTTWLHHWDTHPALTQLLQSLCTPNPSFPLLPPDTPSLPLLQLAFARQLSLGQKNLWFGRLVSDWHSIQATFYQSIQSRRKSRAWASGLVRVLLDVCHGVWSARNEIVHSRTLHGIDILETTQLTIAIQEQFTLGVATLLPADRHLITSRPMDCIHALPVDQKRVWLASIRLARELGSESLQSDQHQMSAIMRQWLHPQSP